MTKREKKIAKRAATATGREAQSLRRRASRARTEEIRQAIAAAASRESVQ